MKIIHVVEWVGRKGGGLSTGVLPLSSELTKIGCNSKVVGAKHKSDDSTFIPNVHSFNVIDGGLFGYSPGIKKYLLSSDVDIIHIHGLWKFSSYIACKVAKKKKIPWVVSTHGMLTKYSLKRSKLKKSIAFSLYVKNILQHAAVIHVMNRDEENYIRSLGINVSIEIVPNGIQIHPFSCNGCNSLSRISKGRKVILYLGRIHPIKGLDILLEAWSKLNEKYYREICLVIAGWGEKNHLSEFKRSLLKYNSSNSVFYIGPQFDNDKHEVYCQADAFILPSLSEGSPVSVLEAWSYSLPVIISEESNLAIGFESGSAHKITLSADVMSDELETFIKMTTIEQQLMGKYGFELVNKRFNWNSIAKKMFKIYCFASSN